MSRYEQKQNNTQQGQSTNYNKIKTSDISNPHNKPPPTIEQLQSLSKQYLINNSSNNQNNVSANLQGDNTIKRLPLPTPDPLNINIDNTSNTIGSNNPKPTIGQFTALNNQKKIKNASKKQNNVSFNLPVDTRPPQQPLVRNIASRDSFKLLPTDTFDSQPSGQAPFNNFMRENSTNSLAVSTSVPSNQSNTIFQLLHTNNNESTPIVFNNTSELPRDRLYLTQKTMLRPEIKINENGQPVVELVENNNLKLIEAIDNPTDYNNVLQSINEIIDDTRIGLLNNKILLPLQSNNTISLNSETLYENQFINEVIINDTKNNVNMQKYVNFIKMLISIDIFNNKKTVFGDDDILQNKLKYAIKLLHEEFKLETPSHEYVEIYFNIIYMLHKTIYLIKIKQPQVDRNKYYDIIIKRLEYFIEEYNKSFYKLVDEIVIDYFGKDNPQPKETIFENVFFTKSLDNQKRRIIRFSKTVELLNAYEDTDTSISNVLNSINARIQNAKTYDKIKQINDVITSYGQPTTTDIIYIIEFYTKLRDILKYYDAFKFSVKENIKEITSRIHKYLNDNGHTGIPANQTIKNLNADLNKFNKNDELYKMPGGAGKLYNRYSRANKNTLTTGGRHSSTYTKRQNQNHITRKNNKIYKKKFYKSVKNYL